MDILSQSYFDLFGLPEAFDVDLADLSDRYRRAQRQVHPDRFAHAGAQERRVSMQHAAQINEAYRVLKDPVARATYLLERKGCPLVERAEPADPEFLMEQMELREQLESIPGDAAPAIRLAGLVNEIDRRIRDLRAVLSRALADGSAAELERARDAVLKLQFLDRIRQSADDLEAELAERA